MIGLKSPDCSDACDWSPEVVGVLALGAVGSLEAPVSLCNSSFTGTVVYTQYYCIAYTVFAVYSTHYISVYFTHYSLYSVIHYTVLTTQFEMYISENQRTYDFLRRDSGQELQGINVLGVDPETQRSS